MIDRIEYVVAVDETNRASIDAACAAVFELVLPRAAVGTVDAYIGWPEPPAEVVALERRLIDEHGEDGLMGLPFDLRKPQARHDFVTIAPWSIQAEAADDDGMVLASIHDGGTGVVALLTEEEARLLGECLSDRGHDEVEVVPGDEWDGRRRLRKRNARRRTLRRLIPRRSR